MTDRGSDIDFDFFEEPETQEAPLRERVARRGSGRSVRPPGGLTPLLRLVGLIAFAIALVVVVVFAIQSCRSESKRELYVDYMRSVGAIGTDSQRVGRQLEALLAKPGVRQAELQETIGGFADQQEQDAGRALAVTPPGRLRNQHGELVDSLELRANGLRLLQDAFRASANARGARDAGRILAEPMRRLVASDVIWEDAFRQSSVAVLRRQDVTGVAVPESTFLRDPELATGRSMALIWTRIRGASTGRRTPGPHGNALISVVALPQVIELSREQETQLITSADLAFRVTIENSGRAQEVGVRVRLTMDQPPRTIRRTEVVRVINPGQRRTVTFDDLGAPPIGQRVTVRIDVVPVPDEQNRENNSASFPVTFSLG